MERKICQRRALVIKIDDGKYLSEHNNVVDFNKARIINGPALASKLAKEFNDKSMKDLGMKFDLEIECVDLRFGLNGIRRSVLTDD